MIIENTKIEHRFRYLAFRCLYDRRVRLAWTEFITVNESRPLRGESRNGKWSRLNRLNGDKGCVYFDGDRNAVGSREILRLEEVAEVIEDGIESGRTPAIH